MENKEHGKEIIKYQDCVELWDKQWHDICNLLNDNADSLPKFEELLSKSVFCRVIAQIIEYPEAYTTYSSKITRLFKGVHSESAGVLPDRFIPKWEFVSPNRPNRMNGTDRLYNYFTIEYNDCRGELLEYTSAHEIRLKENDTFWGSDFKFTEDKELKFADLRTKEKIPKDDERCFRFLRSKATHGNKLGKVDKKELEKWTIQVMLGIWEDSQMFAPIDKECGDLWLQYRPFHLLCDFFERQGFDGIIYRSTVYKKGACLALFDINNAVCIPETITKLDGNKYRKHK